MFFFKACPKCQGDMYVDRDRYGAFVECLQCGLLKDVKRSESTVSYTTSPEFSGTGTTQPPVLRRVA